jgi:hypothetical protein
MVGKYANLMYLGMYKYTLSCGVGKGRGEVTDILIIIHTSLMFLICKHIETSASPNL